MLSSVRLNRLKGKKTLHSATGCIQTPSIAAGRLEMKNNTFSDVSPHYLEVKLSFQKWDSLNFGTRGKTALNA